MFNKNRMFRQRTEHRINAMLCNASLVQCVKKTGRKEKRASFVTLDCTHEVCVCVHNLSKDVLICVYLRLFFFLRIHTRNTCARWMAFPYHFTHPKVISCRFFSFEDGCASQFVDTHILHQWIFFFTSPPNSLSSFIKTDLHSMQWSWWINNFDEYGKFIKKNLPYSIKCTVYFLLLLRFFLNTSNIWNNRGNLSSLPKRTKNIIYIIAMWNAKMTKRNFFNAIISSIVKTHTNFSSN